MEKKINRFLGVVEKIAYLSSNNAVPTTVQVYMFGWFAQKIQPVLTNGERNNLFWELAIYYLDELKKAADEYSKLPNEKRERYLKNICSYTKNIPNKMPLSTALALNEEQNGIAIYNWNNNRYCEATSRNIKKY